MPLFKRDPSRYEGLALYVMGPNWRTSIWRDEEQLPADLLFDTTVLANRLREAGVGVDDIRLEHGNCYVVPTLLPGRTASEGKKIRDALRLHYPLYRGDSIRWRWDIRQYD